ncbi:TPA: iron-containing alcohol dehydrogenase [bacterium]|nr:iron-containing alcohol dehydrogenase [bacterium]
MNSSSVGIFYVPTKIIKGLGALDELGKEIKGFNAQKVLIVTGKNIVKVGAVELVQKILKKSDIESEIFDEVMPDPTVKVVDKGTEIIKNGKFDLIIGLGGGSNIDAAKAMSIMASNEGSICDYEGADKFPNPTLPLIAIPTTVGTGSEVTYSSVITDTDRNYKFVVWSSKIAPKVAILDPHLPATAPSSVIVSAGMDALTHAIESYVSKLANAHSETLALASIRLIADNLRQCVADPHNLTMMSHMQIAANMAGMAFTSTRLGIVHALALPPSAMFHVPHGLANAILLPYGMEFNLLAYPKKFRNIAHAMGENIDNMKLMDAARASVDAVVELADDIGAPVTLQSVGVTQESLPKMAEDAMKSGHIAVNPRQVTLDDAMMILEKAY